MDNVNIHLLNTFQLSQSNPSSTCCRVGPPATGLGPMLPACHWHTVPAADSSIRVAFEPWSGESDLQTLPRSNLPLQSCFKFVNHDRLSFTGKFVIASHYKSLCSSSCVFGLSFKFMIASRCESLFLASSARWPSVRSARDGIVCRAAPVASLLGPLAECPR